MVRMNFFGYQEPESHVKKVSFQLGLDGQAGCSAAVLSGCHVELPPLLLSAHYLLSEHRCSLMSRVSPRLHSTEDTYYALYDLGSLGKHIQSAKYLLQHIRCSVHYVFMNMNTGCLCGFIKTCVLFQAELLTELSQLQPHFWGWRNGSMAKNTCGLCGRPEFGP